MASTSLSLAILQTYRANIYDSLPPKLSRSQVYNSTLYHSNRHNADVFSSLDTSEIKGQVTTRTIPYDYLIYAVGAENQTFGIPGVKEHACFMKELPDAEKMLRRFMDREWELILSLQCFCVDFGPYQLLKLRHSLVRRRKKLTGCFML